jgi:hypothetical protein
VKSRVVVNLDNELDDGRPWGDARSALQLSFCIDARCGNASCIARWRAQPSVGTSGWNAENILRGKVLDAATTVRGRSKNDAKLKRSAASGIREKASRPSKPLEPR